MRFAAFCLLVLLVPSMAFAQDAPSDETIAQARSLYERGALAFEQERWADCASHFEESFTLVFSPTLLYNIARCYEEEAALSHSPESYRRAIAAYVRYLREDPNAEPEPITVRLRDLRADLEAVSPAAVDPATIIRTTVSDLEDVQETLSSSPLLREYVDNTIPPEAAELTASPPQEDSGFAWTYTLTFGIATVVVGIATLITEIVGINDYNTLADTCGMTVAGCDPSDINRVEVLGTTTGVLFGLTSALLVSTGVAFTVEFFNQNTAGPAGTAFGLQLTRSF